MTEFWPSFWQSFWPNLAATIVGLALGLPLALWTNRLVTTYSQRQQRHDDRERLNQTLETLKHAMTLNLSRRERQNSRRSQSRGCTTTAQIYDLIASWAGLDISGLRYSAMGNMVIMPAEGCSFHTTPRTSTVLPDWQHRSFYPKPAECPSVESPTPEYRPELVRRRTGAA
jgi:hypothetical protein